jgi:hypothetical protein
MFIMILEHLVDGLLAVGKHIFFTIITIVLVIAAVAITELVTKRFTR